jgi:calcineurin-like phosphoesterase family protein
MRLGHKILDHEHDGELKLRWHSRVNKNDVIFVLGDVAFTTEALQEFKSWSGNKILIKGNHDDKNEKLYREIFYKTYGILHYKRMWLSHCPIHPAELRGKINIHGHVHKNIVLDPITELPDERYRSVCVEANRGFPENFDKIIEEYKESGVIV